MARWSFIGGAAAALALMTAAGPISAADVMGRIFSAGQLDGVAPARTLIYDYLRHSRDAEKLGADFDDAATLTLRQDAAGARTAEITLLSRSRHRRLDPLSAAASNPLLLAFLESTLLSVAKATGGSPFYIRNRVKDAMRGGGEIEPIEAESGGRMVAAERITFKPFAADAHREQLGDFADLVYEIVLSDAAPGAVVSLSATARIGQELVFEERMALAAETGGQEAK